MMNNQILIDYIQRIINDAKQHQPVPTAVAHQGGRLAALRDLVTFAASLTEDGRFSAQADELAALSDELVKVAK